MKPEFRRRPIGALVAGAAIVCGFFAAPPLRAQPASGNDGRITVAIAGDAGAYSVDRWRKDWPGCEYEGGVAEGHVLVRRDGGENWLRVGCVPGEVGPERGGAGWRWPFGTRTAAELTYTLRFGEGFDFVKGGKLPGLSGGPESVTGGRRADGTNGFSARLMWRRDGRGEAYVYHLRQPGKYGESFPFPEDFRFPAGVPVRVRLAVAMNAPGKRDGTLRVWITVDGRPERLMVEKTDMEWRSTDRFGIDSLLCEVFHGGDDASWAPKRPCWVEFTGFQIESGGAPAK